jgi:hypothetical protein
MIRSTRIRAEEKRWLRVLSVLNEYQPRLYVTDRAMDQGRGGITRLSQLTGMSRTTITKAVSELRGRGRLEEAAEGRVREAGGGRKSVEEADPQLRAYEIGADRAVVNVGITHDTAEFAVESIRRWWTERGQEKSPSQADSNLRGRAPSDRVSENDREGGLGLS